MASLVSINGQGVQVKEFRSQRVVTFKDIDMVHERVEGTASRNFRENRDKFIEGVDYYEITPSKFQLDEIRRFGINSPKGGMLFTESGYLMLVKSLTDNLAWRVQRELVNNYFRGKQLANAINNLNPDQQNLINLELKKNEVEAKLKNARVREANVYLKIAEKVQIPEYQQIMYSKATEVLSGQPLLPLPETEKTYSATDIGLEVGASANMVGRMANKHKLKTPEYGIKVWDKSRSSSKQVETWRYNEKGRQKLIELFEKM